MIVSWQNKYIFVHSRKTAGSSIVVSLSRNLGLDDLVLSAIKEIVEAKIQLPDKVIQTALRTKPISVLFAGYLKSEKYSEAISKGVKKAYMPSLGKKPQHAPAEKIRNTFPREWEEFTKFSVVRNPFDKTVSDYFWRTKGSPNPPDFSTYVHALRDGDKLDGQVPIAHHDNWKSYSIDGCLALDYYVRYESLQKDLINFCNEAGIEYDGWLPNSKGKIRKVRDYRDMYDSNTRSIVADLYGPEIESMGYTF